MGWGETLSSLRVLSRLPLEGGSTESRPTLLESLQAAKILGDCNTDSLPPIGIPGGRVGRPWLRSSSGAELAL